MGEILLARVEGAEGFNRKLVLKGLLPGLDEDTVSLELFRREAQLMARLEHPNIVRVVDFTYVHDKPYLAMEYVRGRNFHQVIQRSILKGEILPVRIALHVVAEVLRGIHYAHHARDEEGRPLGIIHRDISPGNILVSFFGEVRVTDFGIAQAVGTKKLTGPRSIRGKARYAAPEIVRGEKATVRSDVYAAGVVLAEAITGEPLFDGRAVSQTLIQIVTEPRDKTIERIFQGITDEIPGLRAVLTSALALRPEERFSSAAQLADALDSVCRQAGGPVTQAELGGFMQHLFEHAPDMPREGEPQSDPPALARCAEPVSPSRGSGPEEPTPCDRPAKVPSDEVPRPFGARRGPHWRAPERGFELDDEAQATLQLRPTDPAPPPGRLRDSEAPPLARAVSNAPRLGYLFPRVEDAPEAEPAVYFSELLPLPAQTAQERSGSVAEEAVDGLARLGWKLWLKNPWVLVLLGMLLGGATAIIGSLLAISGAGH